MSFWRPWRIERLVLIESMDQLLPDWAVCRWLLAQAAQDLGPSTADRARQALEVAVRVRGGPDALVGVDELDKRCKVIDHDWVFRQLLLYDLGGARHFVRHVAAPDLLCHTERWKDWLDTPMGAYRLVREEPRLLVWTDFATGAVESSLNIGSASLIEPGDCVIGRLVPADDGHVFESMPLAVPEAVARRVLQTPAGWVSALEGVEDLPLGGHEFGLLTDVPIVLQLMVATTWSGIDVDDVRRVGVGSSGEAHGRRAELVRAALADRLVAGSFDVSPYPSIAAALLDPAVVDQVVAGLQPDDAPKLLRLADLLPSPSDAVCRQLAEDVCLAE